MTRRMFDDSLLDNPEYWRLSPEDQRLVVGLVLVADEVGRAPADTRRVRSKACAYADDTPEEIEARLRRISQTLTNPYLFPGRLLLYEVDGLPYYQWQDWLMFQSLDDPHGDGFPAPPGYTWMPDRTDKRRRNAGRWEPTDGTQQTPPQGSANLPAGAPSVPSEAGQQASTPVREAVESTVFPDGFAELSACHEHHSGRPLSSDDNQKLLASLRDAMEAGVPWQVLMTMMKDAQLKYEPNNASPRISRIAYYQPGWDRHIREAMKESRPSGSRARQPESPPPPAALTEDPRERIKRERAAALSGGAVHASAS